MNQMEQESPNTDAALPPPVEEIKQRLESLNEQVTTFIKGNAGLCLLGAVALGYLVARVARKAS